MFKNVIYLFLFLFIFGCSNQENTKTNEIEQTNKIEKEIIQDKEIANLVDEETKQYNENLSDEEILKDLGVEEKKEEEVFDDLNVDSGLETKNTQKDYKKISDLDISNIEDPKECFKINFKYSSEKKECIYEVEQYIIDSATSMKTETCKKLITNEKKQNCFDDLYFYLATKKLKLDSCELIDNNNMKKKCIEDVSIALKQQKEKKQQKENNKKDTVKQEENQDCNDLEDGKLNCFMNLAIKENDLRYCTDNLSGKEKNKCINELFNDILKYNLEKAVETNDTIYCDKIGVDEWIEKCKNNM